MKRRSTSIFPRAAMTLLLMVLTTVSAWAQDPATSGTCGDYGNENNVTWAVTDTNDDGSYETLTISGTGAMKNYGSNPQQPWAAFKSAITTVVIGDGVTRIGGNAFYQFTALTSVTIAPSVTTIGNAVFFECTNLTTVSGASGVTYVDSSAFYETAWENNLPDGLTSVGHVAYRFVGDGTSVNLDAATTQIYDNCFQYSKITSIVIPASVERIGDYAFAHSALQKMYVLRHESSFPEITQLGNDAFEICFHLTIVVPAAAYDNYDGLWFSGQGSSILKRGYTVTCSGTGITFTSTNNGPLVEQDETVTLEAPAGYVIVSASYNDGTNDNEITATQGVYSFTMPASDVTVKATLKKDFTLCTATVPDQTQGRFNPATNSYYKPNKIGYLFGDWPALVGETVEDNGTKLTFGTDYEFGTISYASPDTRDYWTVDNDKIGDVCQVEIIGKGEYIGTKTATFTIVDPSGKWGDTDELTWSLTNGALSITLTNPENGNKAMKTTDNYGKYPWYQYCSDVTSITIGEGITSIANYAFGGQNDFSTYNNVTTVSLPSTLTSIGAGAFRGCSGATISIPTGVTTLGSDPFANVAKVVCTLNDNNSDFYSNITTATTADITYKRTFTKDVASTVCLPFDYTPQGEGTYYTFTAIDKETSPWEVTMTSTAASLTANTPYMFMPAATGEVTYSGTASNFTYNLTGAEVDDPVESGGKWNFIGTYVTKQWNGTHNNDEIGKVYGFAAQSYSTTVSPGNFVKAAVGASIAPFRAYLQYTPANTNAPRRGAEVLPSRMTVRLVNAEGETTSLTPGPSPKGEGSEYWYTLDSRKLDQQPTQKGLYINNGRKVVIK